MAEFEFKLHDDEPTLSHAGVSKCSLCNHKPAKYTCPKCGVSYCGVECYKSRIHSECSEKFYEENVRDEIASRNVTLEQEEAVMQLLTKEVKDVFDESENVDLETRLEGLDLDRDTDEIWERLTQGEKDEFDRTMGRFVPRYKAWWKEFNLVRDESKPDKPLPKLYPNIQSIGDIFTGKPNENLKYDIINVIYTYVCVHRLYNGDFSSKLEHVTEDLVDVSLVLKGEGSFSNLGEALDHPAMKLLQMKELEWSSELVFGFYSDVIEVISRNNLHTSFPYVVYCLSDLWYVFGDCLKLRKKSVAMFNQLKIILYNAQKKIYFFLCWARELHYLLFELCDNIRLELQVKQIELKAFNEANRTVKRNVQRVKQQCKQQVFEEIT